MKLKRIFALVLTAVMLSLLVSAPAMAAAVGKLTTTGSVTIPKCRATFLAAAAGARYWLSRCSRHSTSALVVLRMKMHFGDSGK